MLHCELYVRCGGQTPVIRPLWQWYIEVGIWVLGALRGTTFDDVRDVTFAWARTPDSMRMLCAMQILKGVGAGLVVCDASPRDTLGLGLIRSP